MKVLLFVGNQFLWFLWMTLSTNLSVKRNVISVVQIKASTDPHVGLTPDHIQRIHCISANLPNAPQQDYTQLILKQPKLYNFRSFNSHNTKYC